MLAATKQKNQNPLILIKLLHIGTAILGNLAASHIKQMLPEDASVGLASLTDSLTYCRVPCMLAEALRLRSATAREPL